MKFKCEYSLSPFELILFQQVNKLSEINFEMNLPTVTLILQHIWQLFNSLKTLILSNLSCFDGSNKGDLLWLDITSHLSE